MSDNIHVAVRVRPLIPREIKEDAHVHWKVEKSSVIYQPSSPSISFCFDRVFDADETNDIVYGELCSPIVESVMQGINGTIFAYGQTSSGKTYTMMGDCRNPGIICSTLEDIFNTIQNMSDREFLLRVSYLEIYNETVVDLLSTEERKNLKVQEDYDGYISVCGLEEIVIRTTEDVMNLMKNGEKRRHIGETNMNERSSRSHTIFRMIIESRGRYTDEDSAVIVSQFNLVDLAGSERAGDAFMTERFRESVSINKSLCTLGHIISQLSENDGQFIRYRDSKLTRLLKNSLGGNARTVIICTVTPASVEQTSSTLKFASRAKCIKNKPQVNEVLNDGALLKRYAKKIKELSKQLEEQQNGGDVKAMQLELEEKDRKIENLRQSLRDIKEKIVSNNAPEKFSVIPRNPRRETWGGLITKQNFRPRPLDSLKTICHVPHLATLVEESFSPSTDLSNEFLPEFRENLLCGGRKLSGSPNSMSMSPLRFSLPKTLVHVEIQTDISSLGGISNSAVHTCLEGPHSRGTQEELLELKTYLESVKKEYEELREYTSLEKEVFVTGNGLTDEIKALQEKVKVLQEENTDLFSKLKTTSDKIIVTEQIADKKCGELLEQLDQKDKDIITLNEQVLISEQRIESLASQMQQNEKSAEAAESLKAQYQEAHDSNLVYQSLVKDLEDKVKNLKESNSELTEKIFKLEASYSDVQREISRLITDLNDREIAVASFADQLRTSEKLNADQGMEIKKLNDRLSELANVADLDRSCENNKISSIANQSSTVDDHLSQSVVNESVLCKLESNARSGTLAQELEENQMKVIVLSGQLEECEEQIRTLSSKLDALNSDRIETSGLVENLRAEVEEEKESNSHLQSCIETLKNRISELEEVSGGVKEQPGHNSTAFEIENSAETSDQPFVVKEVTAKQLDEVLHKYIDILDEKDVIIKMMGEEVCYSTTCVADVKTLVEDFVVQKCEYLLEGMNKITASYSEIGSFTSEICQYFGDVHEEIKLYKDLTDLKDQEIVALTDKLLESEKIISKKEELVNLFTVQLSEMEDLVHEIKSQLETSKDSLKKPICNSCSKCAELNSERNCVTESFSEKENESSSLRRQLLASQTAFSEKVSLADSLFEQLHQIQEDISEYKKEINDKENIILVYKNRIEDLERNITEQVSKKDHEIFNLHGQLTDLQNAISAKESLVEDLRKQLDHAQISVAELEREMANKKCAVSEYEKLNNDLETSISELKEEMLCVKEELTTAQVTILQYEKDIEVKNCAVLNYENHFNDLQKKFDEVLSQLRTSHGDEIQRMNCAHEKEKLHLMEDCERRLGEEKEKLTNQFMKDVELKLSELDKKHIEYSITQKNEIQESLKSELSTKHEKQLNSLKQKLLEKGSELEKKIEKLQKTESELALFRAKNQKKNELLNMLNGKVEAAVAASVAEKETIIQGLKSDLELKAAECDSLSEELNTLSRRNVTSVEELVSKLKASHEEQIQRMNDFHEKEKCSLMEDMEKKLTAEKEKLADRFNKNLESKLSELEKKHLENIKQKSETEVRLKLELSNKYETQLNSLKQELLGKEHALEKKLERLEEIENEMTALKIKYQEKESVIQGLNHDLQYKFTECDTLRKELDSMSSGKDEISMEDYKNQFSKSMNKCKGEFYLELNRKNNEIAQLKLTYDKEIKKIEELSQKNLEQDNVIQSLKSSLSLKSEECNSLKKQLENLPNEINLGGGAETVKGHSQTTKENKERESKSFSKKQILEKAQTQDQRMLALKENNEKIVSDFNNLSREKDELKARCSELMSQNQKLIGVLKGETVWLDQQNSDVKAYKEELVRKTDMLTQLSSDFSKQKIELVALRHERQTLVSEIDKLKSEIVRRNEGCVDLQKKESQQNSEKCLDSKNEKITSGSEEMEQLKQDFHNERLRNDKLQDALRHWSEKAENYKQQIRRLKEAKESTMNVDKMSNMALTDEGTDSKPLDETDYSYQSGSVAKYKMYLMDSELYQKNKEIAKLKRENDRMKAIISSKKARRSESAVQRENGVPSTIRQPSEAQNENLLPTSIEPRPKTQTETVVYSGSDTPSTMKLSSQVQNENLLPAFVKPKAKMCGETAMQNDDVTSAMKLSSQIQNENVLSTFVRPRPKMQGGIAMQIDNDIPSIIKQLSQTQNENIPPTFAKPRPKMQSKNDVPSAIKLSSQIQNENVPPTFVRPSPKVQSVTEVQDKNDIPSAVTMLPQIQNETIAPAFAKPGGNVQSENYMPSATKKPSQVETQNVPPTFVKSRPKIQSEIAVHNRNDIPSAIKSSSQIQSEPIPPKFVKPKGNAQNKIAPQGEDDLSAASKKLSQMQIENIPPSVFMHRHKVRRLNEMPSATMKSSEMQNVNIPATFVKPRPAVHNEITVQAANDMPPEIKRPSQVQRENTLLTSAKPGPKQRSVKSVPAPVKSLLDPTSVKTPQGSGRLLSNLQSANAIPATVKPLAELQTSGNYGRLVPSCDRPQTNTTRITHDGFSTEVKKPGNKLPHSEKRKFNDSNECKQQ